MQAFEKKAQQDLAEANAELQIVLHESEKYQRLYNSVKMKNEELKLQIENRNQEFVDFRKGVNSNVFKDMKMQEHVEFQMIHMRSRYESTI